MNFGIGAGFVLSSAVGILGYRRGFLSKGGVFGAILTGTPILGFGGTLWGFLLVAFFFSSSLLSHIRSPAKILLADKFQKGSRRDLGQALANGGWAAVLAIAFGIWHAQLIFFPFVGAIATVTADTWATEIGVLSKEPPRLITNGRIVPTGTSGGLTVLGTLCALSGAALIGVLAVTMAPIFRLVPWWNVPALGEIGLPSSGFSLIFLSSLSGLAGSLADSLLGATCQAIYYCDFDRKETERPIHACGRRTRRLRGYSWMENDMVNFLSSILGSSFAVLLAALLTRLS